MAAKRSSNWSSAEEEALADAITKYGEVIRGKFSLTLTNFKKKDAWEKIVNLVNAADGNNRDLEQVKKKYYNLTSATKKIESNNQRSRKKTGGGESEIITLTGTQEKILSSIPVELITGIEGGFDTGDQDSIQGKCGINRQKPFLHTLNAKQYNIYITVLVGPLWKRLQEACL